MSLDVEKTAVERDARLTCLLTTEEVIWMDEGQAGQSTLRWKHDMGDLHGARVVVYPRATHGQYDSP